MSKKKSQERSQVKDYRSWDPLTQSKFLYDLHQTIGPELSRAEAYSIAANAVQPAAINEDGNFNLSSND